ncbi:MAG: UPF0280 family protein [Pseudooceanicola sp.]
MEGPAAAWLDNGERLHLQHGPIDLIIAAEGGEPARRAAFAAAMGRFETVLPELVTELATLRAPLRPEAEAPGGAVARRMHEAAMPFAGDEFLTRMIAVAGSVADEVLAAMTAAATLTSAHVNNGGDIAVHLSESAVFTAAIAAPSGRPLGRIQFGADDGIGGIATSGAGGRSHSLGIADSVTVLATSAAAADAAATLIANAVDLPGHPGITRRPARELDPDSDLGDRNIVTAIPRLSPVEAETALARGAARARQMQRSGRITGAALFLQDARIVIGPNLVTTADPG